MGAASFSIRFGLCQKSCAVPGCMFPQKGRELGVGTGSQLPPHQNGSGKTSQSLCFHVLIWKGALEQETWRCPSHHLSQQGCWEEQTSSSFLAILDSERLSQMLIVFVLTVCILLYRFPVLWKERWPLLN